MKNLSKILVILLMSVSFTGCVTILNVQTLNKKAAEYMAKEDYDNAIARLVSIIDIDPNHPEVHYNLAMAYVKKEDYEKALTELEKAIELKPSLIDAYYSLGVVNEALAESIIEDMDATVAPLKKEEKRKELSKYVKGIFINYAKYIELSPDGYEKSRVEGQLEHLKDKYKTHFIMQDLHNQKDDTNNHHEH